MLGAGALVGVCCPALAAAHPGRGHSRVVVSPGNRVVAPPGFGRIAPPHPVQVGFSSPTGCTSTLTGSVNGGLVVPSNARYCLLGAHIHGGTSVQPGGEVILEGATIDGGLRTNQATDVRVCASRVNGPTTIQNGGGTVLIGAALDDGAAACPGNTLHGPLTISSNLAGIEVESDWITGPVTLTNNEGPAFLGSEAGAEVEANRISGPLTCSGNTPAPVNDGLPNTVTGPETGQCAGF
jgi:hexosaminidase